MSIHSWLRCRRYVLSSSIPSSISPNFETLADLFTLPFCRKHPSFREFCCKTPLRNVISSGPKLLTPASYLSKWYTKSELNLRMSIFYSGSLLVSFLSPALMV